MTCAWIGDVEGGDGLRRRRPASGLDGEGAGDADALALAAGELVRDSGDRWSGFGGRRGLEEGDDLRRLEVGAALRARPWMLSASPMIAADGHGGG